MKMKVLIGSFYTNMVLKYDFIILSLCACLYIKRETETGRHRDTGAPNGKVPRAL